MRGRIVQRSLARILSHRSSGNNVGTDGKASIVNPSSDEFADHLERVVVTIKQGIIRAFESPDLFPNTDRRAFHMGPEGNDGLMWEYSEQLVYRRRIGRLCAAPTSKLHLRIFHRRTVATLF